jgi:two-component system, cell cycle response regulator DivK
MAAVLIVDSSSDQCDPYVSSLRDSGFEVVVVPTAEQACAAVESLCPEVVVAHVHGEDAPTLGIEITRYLRAQPEIDDIPVVVMTGSLDHSQATAVVAAGCDRYLRVPVAPQRLVTEVREVSEHARRLRNRSALVLVRAAHLREKSEALLLRSDTLRDCAAVVTTDKFGTVVGLNDAASSLLNVSVRGGVGRNLLMFVDGERDRISRGLAQASAGYSTGHRFTLRPRERKAVPVTVEMKADEETTGNVDWIIRRA